MKKNLLKILTLSLLMSSGVALGDDSNTIDTYKQSCNNGDSTGCFNLGLFYITGKDTPRNYSMASEMFKKSCDIGNPYGCFNLGTMYQYGKIVRKDIGLARIYYEKACNMNFQTGCNLYTKLRR